MKVDCVDGTDEKGCSKYIFLLHIHSKIEPYKLTQLLSLIVTKEATLFRIQSRSFFSTNVFFWQIKFFKGKFKKELDFFK